jgi:hypothetical protein
LKKERDEKKNKRGNAMRKKVEFLPTSDLSEEKRITLEKPVL